MIIWDISGYFGRFCDSFKDRFPEGCNFFGIFGIILGLFWDILGFFEMLEISSGSLEVRGIVEGFSTDSCDFQSIYKDILGFLIDS